MSESGGHPMMERAQFRAPHFKSALSGAVGVFLAAFTYLISIRVGGRLGPVVPVREAEIVVFLLLLAVSVFEMPVMLFGLRRMRAANMNSALIHAVNMLFVAFASVYAAVQVILFGESNLSILLAGLSLARWVAASWMV